MINLLFLLGDVLEKGFIGIILTLDTLIYGLISSAFKVFMAIASARLLSSDAYYAIANKVYLIIGVLMLFVLSYSILKAIVNPDEGKKSFGPGIIKRIVIAVVGLAVTPALFNLMYQAQGLVLEHDVLAKLFFRSESTTKITTDGQVTISGVSAPIAEEINPDDYVKVVGGSYTATTIWQAFFYPAPDSGLGADEITADPSDYYLKAAGWGVACGAIAAGTAVATGIAIANEWNPVGWILTIGVVAATAACGAAYVNYDAAETGTAISDKEISLEQAYAATASGESFGLYTIFLDNYLDDGEITYLFGVSTLCGAFALYAFASFSIDMGIRAAKLAYYQIIAPVPLIMQVLPGKGESTFKEYTKGVLHTFLEVFIRIAVVYIVVYIICHLQVLFSSVDALWGNQNLSTPEVMLAMALLIIGLIMFCKDAPKFLAKTLGIDGGNLHLGIGKKLADGGAYTAASAIGSGITAGVNNVTNKWKNADNWKNKHGNVTLGSITKNLIGGVASGAAGTVSGGVRGGIAGKDAKKFRDVRTAATQGAQGAIRARDNREAYAKASEKYKLGVIQHKLEDKVNGVIRWAGIDNAASLDAELKTLTELEQKADALKTAAKNQIEGDVNKNKRNVTYGVTTRFSTLVTDRASGTTGLAAYDAKNGTRFSALTGASAIANIDSGFNTSVLKDIKDRMSKAQATGSCDGIDYAAWQDLYNFYLKNFGDEVQNRALLSDTNYAGLSSGDQAALSGVRSAALEFRTALGDNLGATVIADANNEVERTGGQVINASNLSSQNLIVNQDSRGNKSAISELGNRIRITRAEVTRKRQEIRKKEEAAGGSGKPKS